MKRCISLLFIVLSIGYAAAQNLVFSGGHFHSAMLCDNGTVYTFGLGTYGQLGNGGNVSSNSPVQVVGEGGVGILNGIKQVDAGSGEFVVALSNCGDSVYTWGRNNEGQLGHSTIQAAGDPGYNTPQRVVGIGGVGYLTDIRFISGGNGETYAITDNDEVIAWGGNDYGQLGRGTTSAGEINPDYVYTSAGVRLNNAKFVDGGDDFGVALLNDGTVWFWGKDARGAGGQGVTTNDPGVTRVYAVQVKDATGTGFLSNIVKVTAGDRHVLALDADGNLWSWGANWGRQLGDNSNDNRGLPVQVHGIDNVGFLNNVRNIAAGNAHSIAVLNDGTVVSWGIARYGNLGNNVISDATADRAAYPVYTMNPANTAPLSNIVNVSDGDNWSFAIDESRNVYVWGQNEDGQLGISSNTNTGLPTTISLPCTLNPSSELEPYANLGEDIDLCSPLEATLNSGSSALEFVYAWYQDNILIPAETNPTLAINEPGEYIVSVSYTTQTCDGPEVETVFDTIEITSSAPTAVHGEYCPGGTATIGVIGSGEYKWYDAETNGNTIGAGGSITTPVLTGPGTQTFWVSDTASFSTTIGPTYASNGGSGYNRDPYPADQNQIAFVTTTSLTIDYVTVGAYHEWDGDYAIEVSVVDANTDVVVNSAWSEVMSGTANFTEHRIYLGLDVPYAGTFYLRYTNSTNGNDRLLAGASGSVDPSAYPFTELTGIISITDYHRDNGTSDRGRFGLFWEWEVSTGAVCDRTPVEAIENCPPCVNPGTVSLAPGGPVEICEGTQVLTATTTGTAPLGGFEYEFFYDDGGGASTFQGPNNTPSTTAISSGSYYVVVFDPTDPIACSATSNTVDVSIYQNPSDPLAGSPETICATTTTLTGTVLTVGTGEWSVVSGSGNFGDESNAQSSVTGMVAGENTFRWTASNGVCEDKVDEVTITVDAPPSTSFAGESRIICADNTTLEGTDLTVGLGQWTVVSGSGVFGDDTDAQSIVTGLSIGSNTFRWTTSNGVCANDQDEVTITVDEFPSEATAGEDQALCAETAVLNASIPASGSGLWTLKSGTATIVDATNPNSTLQNIGVGVVELIWTVSNGVCPVSKDSVQLERTANAAAQVDISPVTPAPVCIGASLDFTALPTNGGNVPTYEWFVNGQSQGGASTVTSFELLNPSKADTILVEMVSDLACVTGGPVLSDTVFVTIDQMPSTAQAGDDQIICASQTTLNAVELTVGTGTWAVFSGSTQLVDPNDSKTTAANLGAGTTILIWTATNGVCPASTDTVEIVVEEVPTVADAGNDVTICASSYDLNAETPTVGTASWLLVQGSGVIADPTNPNSIVTGLGIGENRMNWVVSNGGCEEVYDSVIISVDENPTRAVAGSDQFLCADNSTLGATPITTGSGEWTLISGGLTLEETGNPNSTISNIQVGESELLWTVSNGVCPVSVDTVLISRIANAPATVTLEPGSPAPVCEGDDLTFTALPTNEGDNPTYEWFLGPLSQGPAAANASHTFTSPNDGDVVHVVMTSSLACATGSPATSNFVAIAIDEIPDASNAGNGGEICSESMDLSANLPSSGTGVWSVTAGSGNFDDPNSPTTRVTSLSQGLNILAWTIESGVCPLETDTIIITVSGDATVAQVGNDQVLCENQVASITGNDISSNETGTWSTSGDGMFGSVVAVQTDYSPGVQDIADGSVTLTWTIDNGVCAPTADNMVISLDQLPTRAVAGEDSTLCHDFLQLYANNSSVGIGTWTVMSGSGTIADSDRNDPSALITGLDGLTVVRWEIEHGACPVSVSEITLNSLGTVTPELRLDTDKNEYCEGDEVTISATPLNGSTSPAIEWSLNGGEVNQTGTEFVASNLGDGDRVSAVLTSNLSCVDVATAEMDVILSMAATPSIQTSGIYAFCESTSGSITVVGKQTESTLTWLFEGAEVSVEGTTKDLSMADEGTWLVLEDNGVCPVDTSDVIIVTVDEVPFVDAGDDATFTLEDEIVLDGDYITGTAQWSPSDKLTNEMDKNPSFYPEFVGTYHFAFTVTDGLCSNTDSVEITVVKPFFIPNAFSPNGDGSNDTWEIQGIEAYPNATVRIFNRWGNVVYESYGSFKAWDGLRNGKLMPVATYYYVLNLNNESIENPAGALTLMR